MKGIEDTTNQHGQPCYMCGDNEGYVHGEDLDCSGGSYWHPHCFIKDMADKPNDWVNGWLRMFGVPEKYWLPE